MEEKNEIVLNEKTVEKIKGIIVEQQKLQSSLVALVQTILDYEGLDGKWDFSRTNGSVDITKLIRVEEKLTKEED